MIRKLLALFMRRPPTLFQRCLAVHIASTSTKGGLHG